MVTTLQTGYKPGSVQQQNIPLSPDKTQQARRVAGADVKTQSDAAIVKASLQVSINAKNETMRLLLQSVSANLNEALKPYLGETQAQQGAQTTAPVDAAAGSDTVDYSPEATADRIFRLATGFYEAFKAQHPGDAADATLNHFLDVIKGGIDQGFKEARGVLEGLGVLQGSISANIDQTYGLIQDKLGEWQKQMLEGLKTATPAV
jgi:hypothetical protein